MARGAAQQQNLLNQNAGTNEANAQNSYGAASQGYQGILANPGFSKDQVNTQMDAAMTPIAGQVASGQAQLANRAAATRNTAGMVAGQRDLARTGAQLGSQAGYGVQVGADKNAQEQTMSALGGMSSLYGTSSGAAGNLYGQATTAMNDRNSVLNSLQQGVKMVVNPGGFSSPGGG